MAENVEMTPTGNDFFKIMYLRKEECCEAVREICGLESQQIHLTLRLPD